MCSIQLIGMSKPTLSVDGNDMTVGKKRDVKFGNYESITFYKKTKEVSNLSVFPMLNSLRDEEVIFVF